MFLVCSDCNENISGKKVILSSLVYGKCNICGYSLGKRIIYTQKERIKSTQRAKNIVLNMRGFNDFLLKKDEEGETIFLSEVPSEKLKPGIVKVMHLRKGPKNVECLFAQETKKGVEFVHGFHHDEFCPAIRYTTIKRRS